MLDSCHGLVVVCRLPSKLKFSFFRNTIRVPNGLDPDQHRLTVCPDLCSICLQRFSSDDKMTASKKRKKISRALKKWALSIRVKSCNFELQVNSDIHLQTVDIQMRRLCISSGFSLFAVQFLYFFIQKIKQMEQTRSLSEFYLMSEVT